jgi:2-amino-4-hydroxy-6-hydroxymethyldihydropteridine diphosphokinase
MFPGKGIDIIHSSGIYESEPWGFETDDQFLNQVFEVTTVHPPEELLDILLSIELQALRKRSDSKQYESRTLDLDILAYDERVIQTPRLEVPHPRMHLRKFVLVPLHEIAGNWVHPVIKKNTRQMLDECEDKGKVIKITS